MGARSDAAREAGPNPDAVALLERFGAQMLATARRYTATPHDAEDAYQRATEILLTHRPTGSEDELCRWLRTTTKHEALAIGRQRRRVVPSGEPGGVLEPTAGADAHDHAERLERLRLGAQALRHLKPQEIRCLRLKAEGYSYREICETTGFSYTKVNRCLTEGRRSFLERVTRIEAGEECDRLSGRLSALADGEATAADLTSLRPHLKTCLICRSRLREYRTVPARVAAVAAPAAIATSGSGGPLRGMLESLLGAAQDKAAAFGERAHAAAELASAQKVAAVAASAAALAGGGAGVDRLQQRDAAAMTPAPDVGKTERKAMGPAAAPPAIGVAPAPPASAPDPAPAAQPAPAPPPQPPPPPPDPATEFTPAAAVPAAAAAPPTRPAPPSGDARGTGGGEFAP